MLIVDTGPIVAAADTADPDHRVCTALLEGDPGPLVTTALVATEAAWLIRRELGARSEAVFFQAIAADELRVEAMTGADWGRIADLVTEYDDLGLDAADASVVAIAERLGADTIATLDHRDFRVVRPVHRETFTLVPDLAS